MPSRLFYPATADEPCRPLVIAEVGVNHDGRVDVAVRLVEAAARAGADAVKLQLFHPERLLSREAVLAAYQEAAAGSVAELLAALTLTRAELSGVRDAARRAGLLFIVTPFSPGDVAEVGELAPDAVKIASPDAVNPPLYDAVAGLGLPMIVSTGTCTLEELDPVATLLRARPAGGALLQCVSAYPVTEEDAAMGGIAVLAERYDLPVGYSDHTAADDTAAPAVAAGACVLEKHLTHDRNAPGPDHAASLEPDAFARYVASARRAAAMLGRLRKAPLPAELDVAHVARQSVATTRGLPAGHCLTREDLTVMRPGTGIPASRLDHALGRILAHDKPPHSLLHNADLT